MNLSFETHFSSSSSAAQGEFRMKRNHTFLSPARQPLLEHPRAKLNEDKIQGYAHAHSSRADLSFLRALDGSGAH